MELEEGQQFGDQATQLIDVYSGFQQIVDGILGTISEV